MKTNFQCIDFGVCNLCFDMLNGALTSQMDCLEIDITNLYTQCICDHVQDVLSREQAVMTATVIKRIH